MNANPHTHHQPPISLVHGMFYFYSIHTNKNLIAFTISSADDQISGSGTEQPTKGEADYSIPEWSGLTM